MKPAERSVVAAIATTQVKTGRQWSRCDGAGKKGQGTGVVGRTATAGRRNARKNTANVSMREWHVRWSAGVMIVLTIYDMEGSWV